MCNLYRMTRPQAEVARLFAAAVDAPLNAAEEVYPGYPGLVVADGRLRPMVWGFPLTLKSKVTGQPLKPKPVNNARADKLDGFMWRDSFARRRCLIPLTAWAEAEGSRGAKTRSWVSLPDAPLFAVAGLWRESAEWGACYSMVMVDSAGEAATLHGRMPVVLRDDARTAWQEGSPAEAAEVCTGYAGAVAIDRTAEPWSRR